MPTAGEIRESKSSKADAELRNQLRSARNASNDLRAQLKTLQHEFDNYRAESEFLELCDTRDETINPITPHLRSQEGEAIGIGAMADVHGLLTVKPEQVNDLNEVTPEITERRVLNAFRGFVRLVQIERSAVAVPKFMLILCGDMINNQLRPDQIENNAGTPQEESRFMAKILRRGIDYILEEGAFEEVIVVAADGNHDRDTDKKRVWNRSRHSYEWLMMQNLRDLYEMKGEKRLRWHIAEGYHTYVPMEYGLNPKHPTRNIRVHHGDGIGYQGGVGGLTIPVMKAIYRANTGRHADLDVFGHHHQDFAPSDVAPFCCVNCICGYTPYSAVIHAPYAPPGARFLLVDKKRWLTSSRPVFVD